MPTDASLGLVALDARPPTPDGLPLHQGSGSA